jgi:hypothetical protein
MKRSAFVLFVLMLALTTTTSAQVIKYGLKAGVNLADMTGDGWATKGAVDEVAIDRKFRLGFGGGLFAQFPIGSSGLMVQPEAMFIMKGFRYETGLDDVTTSGVLNYVEVPVLLKYRSPKQRKTSPNLFAGPYAAFNIGGKVTFSNVPAGDEDGYEDIDIDNIKALDFGITFGGGLDFAIGPTGKLTFDVRYTMGLADAFDDVTAEEAASFEENTGALVDDHNKGFKLKNSDIRFMVGYAF